MASFTRMIQAGNAFAFGWFIDGNGFITGASPTAPATGIVGSGAFRIRGVKSASIGIPTPDGVVVSGDDEALGEFMFPSIEVRRFDIEYSVENLEVLATMLNVTLQTWGEARVALNDIPNPPEYNMGFILQSKAKKFNEGVQGQAGWGGVIIPLATAMPLGRAAFEERGAAVFRYSVSPQTAGYDPRGFTINTTTYNASGGRQLPITSENPLHVKTWRGNNSADEFNLDFTPVHADKTPMYVNRVQATVNSIDTSADTVTVSAAPATNAVIQSVYEFTG